jgi:16S rRNA processing protein RimM
MQLVVGRITKAHGIAGEVSVDVRTDDPDHRFAEGTTLDTDPPERGPLVVQTARWHSGRLLVRFVGIPDRNGAEALRGVQLVADSASSRSSDEDGYWDHDLIGLQMRDREGVLVGDVVDVLHLPGSPVLVVRAADDGREALVPFVTAIVPTVDLARGLVVVDPPVGLLDLREL